MSAPKIVDDTRTTATSDAAPVRKKKSKKFSPWAVVAWIVGLGFFFPVFWMVLTSFKQESDAATSPPTLFFTPTLDQYSGGLRLRASGPRC